MLEFSGACPLIRSTVERWWSPDRCAYHADMAMALCPAKECLSDLSRSWPTKSRRWLELAVSGLHKVKEWVGAVVRTDPNIDAHTHGISPWGDTRSQWQKPIIYYGKVSQDV